jgi:hypothetical protein
VVELERALARQMPDETIAAVLNRSGKSTGHGNSWTRGRICSLRHQYGIAIYRVAASGGPITEAACWSYQWHAAVGASE